MKKIITILFVLLSLTKLNSQCSASFVYTINAAGNVTFSSTSTFTGTIFYSWSFGDYQMSSVANPSHAYAGNGYYVVSLTIHDTTYSCNNTFTQSITISNTACIVSAGTSTTQNANGVVVFNNTSTGTSPSTTYTLSYGDNSSSNSFGPHTYSASGNYTISLTASNLPSCTSVYTAVINVVVQACTLTANFVSSISGGTVTFTNTSVGTTSSTTYSWNFGNSNYSALQSPPPQNYLANGTYTVTLTVQDSAMFYCSSTITKTIAITNAPCYINSGFWLAKDSTQLPAIVWDAYPNYPSNIVSVLWNWGDNTTSNTMYPSHTYSAAGMYTICLTVSVSCGGSTTTCTGSNIYRTSESMAMARVNVINQSTGIKNNMNTLLKEIVVQPNPSNGSFSITNMNKLFNQLIIYNHLGAQAYIANISDQTDINLNLDLPNGVYFVQLSSGTLTKTNKVLINK